MLSKKDRDSILDVNRMLRNFNNDQLRDLFAVVDSIAEERARPAREFMRQVQFDTDRQWCYGCGSDKGECRPDCEWSAEIAKLPKVTT